MGVADVKARKGIGRKDDLLDCVDHAELAANYFRITQTQQRLERDSVQDERSANQTHFDVGREVRTPCNGSAARDQKTFQLLHL